MHRNGNLKSIQRFMRNGVSGSFSSASSVLPLPLLVTVMSNIWSNFR